jgi:hypothetical protein
MGDRGFSEILEAEQYFIRRLADLADCLQAAATSALRIRAGSSTSLIGVPAGSSGVGSTIFGSLISPSPFHYGEARSIFFIARVA